MLGALSNSRFYFVDLNNQTVLDLVKNVVANHKGLNRYTFWGGCQLNVQGFYIMHVYESDVVDGNGLPRYASGIVTLQGELHHFHVANYVFNDRML